MQTIFASEPKKPENEMKIMEHYFAIDLGATSGRTIVGCVIDGRLQSELPVLTINC